MHKLSFDTTLTEGPSNSYLFTDSPVTLIDTGINISRIRDQFRATLTDYGLNVEDIDQILLTHFHPDHTGLAGFIQQAGNADVYVHTADQELVSPSYAEWERFCGQEMDVLKASCVPREKMQIAERHQNTNFDFYSSSLKVREIEAGETIAAGSSTVTVRHTPGHTLGSCCFESPEYGLFTGDTLLPIYTPNIGGADVRPTDPLGQYLQSLRDLSKGYTGPANPGHRKQIDNIGKRAREVIVHHESQARQLLRILDDNGPLTAWQSTNHLYGGVQELHIMLGVGETYALLEFLRKDGVVEKSAKSYQSAQREPVERENTLSEMFQI